ncbi:glycoside hydrolase family 3 N-terminal domain-containing protein [Collimonas fungivorans]|uniref:glycoside hydrolase family 3 protein n=1 Tax=Collimonas fungivorans TaxID=158899 RepID=UPI0026EC7ABE|nr:glycoside hydrolase family 3 N-terminal domain-containing protein [Collimonas fungivorans]
MTTLVLSAATVAIYGCGGDNGNQGKQADIKSMTGNLITVDGLSFKDLNHDGKLQPYEDWRLAPEARTSDLLSRMTPVEKAGAMVHATPPSAGTVPGGGSSWDMAGLGQMIGQQGINSFINRLAGPAASLADQANQAQIVAEKSRLGIPVSFSSDPRNHFQTTAGASVDSSGFSQWPETTGLAAIGDADLMRRFGDIARQEYQAVGIQIALSPQADVSTEPRWSRINGTFGEDNQLTKKLVQAYIEGFQNGADGIGRNSVIAVVKHWAGYGAETDGFDGHNYYGRHLTFPGNNFEYHLLPFTGAFAAKAGSVMPTYSMPPAGLLVQGVTGPLEQVGAAFSKQMLTQLLRGRFAFDGVILTDWAVVEDCDNACMNGTAAGVPPSFIGFGTPWGVETLAKSDRFLKALDAGVDQFGGSNEPQYIVDLVNAGKVSVARLDQSAYRILLQKFKQGLFENPYVDTAKATQVVGNSGFQSEALDAQRRSLVLLQNQGAVLPLKTGAGKKVYLYQVAADVAAQYGFTVVARPQDADVAIVRVSAPYQTLHPNYVFGAMQHEGSLAWTDGQADYEAIKSISSVVPTVVSVYMDRPAVLTNVVDKAKAVVANFGVSDKALFDVLTGAAKPQGKLPFELPSSMDEVLAQKSDVASDTAHPLFRMGFGLGY